MVFSYYITKYPYKIVWHILKAMGKTEKTVLYCGNEIDIKIFEPVQKYLKQVPIVVKNKKIQKKFAEKGIKSKRLPCFPEAVITCRQAAYRFPEEKIIKFGMRHGAYHFKPFANTKGYNMHTRFFFTSRTEVEKALEAGITCGDAVGYPKLDAAFDGTYDADYLREIKKNAGIDETKKTILFTATWDKSGISAVKKWYDRLDEFSSNFNVLVTVHPSTSESYKEVIKKTDDVFFIEDNNVVPYIMISDVCVGDTSSILAECCALMKSIITFKVEDGKRTVSEVKEIISSISIQIKDFSELKDSVSYMIANPHEKKEAMERANKIMFDELDGKAGKRAADKILEFIPDLKKKD